MKVVDLGGSAKSLVAAIIAGLTSYQTALLDGNVSQSEWISVALATLLALGAVYSVANTDDKKVPSEEVEPEEYEYSEPAEPIVEEAEVA